MGVFTKKKIWSAIWYILLAAGILTGCGNSKGLDAQAQDMEKDVTSALLSAEKLNIVCTTFPQYDWVMQILGENQEYADVTYLLKNGVDIHSYQPSAEDMITISDCDLLIYIGGQSEQWIEDALKNSGNKNQKTINMMEFLGERVWEEETVEGMQEGEHVHEEESDDTKSDYRLEKVEYDEHVWLSLKNAELICQEISEVLGELDTKHQDVYKENKAVYLEKLENLDSLYQNIVDSASQKTILVADRFPFRYLTEDYDLKYYAAFAGCSAETEASFETVAFLASKVDELELPVVYQIETSDDSLARTVVKNTAQKNQSILTLDSMQSVTEKEIDNGVTYLSIMENNLELLKWGLGYK